MSEKIKPHHLDRKAMLYVRQSSVQQVMHNQESRILQYAMQERLRALGWSEIEIVDDDLGRSAAGTVARAGFERMVAEVCLGQGRCRRGQRGVAVRPQQPRLATAHRDVPGGRHPAGRPGGDLCAAPG
jgi:Resolvase, N terminal domain